jgi:hypothetical protein
MGLIANTLLAILREQLEQKHVVVWFDPECAYTKVAAELRLRLQDKDPETVFVYYEAEQGFLALRRDLEPVWNREEPPRLLIYVPALTEKQGRPALIEYLAGGICLESETRLGRIARLALEPVLPAASMEKILADLQHGRLNLAEIEALAESGQAAQMGALSIIFQTGSLEEMALQFLTDPAVDQKLNEKSAGPAFAGVLAEAFDANLGSGADLAGLRAQLRRQVLRTEFLQTISGAIPTALKSISLAKSNAARQACVHLAGAWRLRRDLAGSYSQAAQVVEAELGTGSLVWTLNGLCTSETFLRAEQVLQGLVEQQLADRSIPDKNIRELGELVQERLKGFWSGLLADVRLRWQVIAGGCQVLLRAAAVQHVLKGDNSANGLFQRYVGKDHSDLDAWCELDGAQRRMQQDFHNLELDLQADDSLVKMVAAAGQGYAEAAHQLTGRFIRAYEAAGFHLPETLQQVDIFHKFVDPAADEGSVAYVLVDAFRYEMARQIVGQLPGEYQVQLAHALASVPTITEVGMGALMPGAENGIAISEAGSSALGVRIQDTFLRSRPDRVKYLEKKGPSPVVVVELNQIAPLKQKALANSVKAARLVVVTATEEIDGLWENQPHMAQQLQDHIFDQLRRGIRSLFNLGIKQVIITADHGFLVGDMLMTGEPLDPPGGETADLHRRVWVGRGGAAIAACLRKPLSAFGIGGDLELVTPYGLSTFKVPGGSKEYYHGGLSLQELVIPVLIIRAGALKSGQELSLFKLEVIPGSQQISNRFFSVTVKGTAKDLLSVAVPPQVRVELRSGDQIISMPVAASYGFNDATRDVSMRFTPEAVMSLEANTITLQITDIPSASTVSLLILDETGRGIHPEMKLPLNITF